MKKLLLRAAGEEGVAERLVMAGSVWGASAQQALDPLIPATSPAANLGQNLGHKVHEWVEHRYETRYESSWSRVQCIDTSGEAFAIYLNLLYLSPLTFLFVRFFIRAYTQRRRQSDAGLTSASSSTTGASDLDSKGKVRAKKAGRKASDLLRDARLAAGDASRATQASLESESEKVEDGVMESETQAEEAVRRDVERVVQELRAGGKSPSVQKAKEVANSALEKGKAGANQAGEKVKAGVEAAAGKVEEVSKQAGKKGKSQAQGQGQAQGGKDNGDKSEEFKKAALAERQSSQNWMSSSTTSTSSNTGGNGGNGGGGLFNRSFASEGESDAVDNAEPASTQEANLEASQALRPEGEIAEGDTDDMGRSGAIVDRREVEG